MRGVTTFNGARLREAREARGLTKVALSGLLDVSPQSVSAYENGTHTPSPPTLASLARALNFPMSFFVLPDRSDPRAPIFYRSLASATKTARMRAEHRFTWLRDIVAWVSVDVALPTPDLPDLGAPVNPLLLDDDDIEEAASRLRTEWRLGDGPIANVVGMLEHHGAIVARDTLETTTLDSLCELDPADGRAYVLISTDKGTAVRWRFDAAHELGHMLLHQGVERSALTRSDVHKHLEHQAHRFAAALLLPAAAFGDDLFGANLDAFLSIKPKWKTSVGMMIRRARDVGFISEETEKRLWVSYSRRKWRRSEPLDDEIPPEGPKVLAGALDMVWSLGERTVDDLAESLSLPLSEIERLAHLHPGVLSGRAPVVSRLAAENNVLQFPRPV